MGYYIPCSVLLLILDSLTIRVGNLGNYLGNRRAHYAKYTYYIDVDYSE